jgi:hypothetical protein
MIKVASGVRTPDFRQVRPTPEERADWAKRYPNRAKFPPYRSQCVRCGTRIWHSGIAIGSHRRACKGVQA